ncbi:MAG TPA: penicillin acylase family protein [Gemmatimonadaceae bacterium]|nr:penicillin acylase family protein [Gemmatimonadaceae bacterium]
MRAGVAAVLLAALLFAGFRPIGPVPPIGGLLDPANGVWATARSVNLRPVDGARIPGLQQPVEVVIDDRGVPHIFALSENDAYRALGYVVARDRLFQMEAQTRAASGRLTEWAGKRALEADRDSRSLGLVWGAERKMKGYDKSSPGYQAMLAYADGVNAWISQMRPRDLPVEYRLLNARPIKWEPIHSLYFFSRMALTLGFNDASLRRLRAQALVGRAAADALYPVNSPIQEPIQPNGLSVPRKDFATLPPPGPPDSAARLAVKAIMAARSGLGLARANANGDALGSNNWAVSPKRSATGNAILAGDPHLDLSLPSVWYEMHIVVPGKLDVAGVGFPGVPGVVIGFNRDVAWTFTNTGSDVNDYFVETVDNAARPTKYQVDGSWRDLERRIETYRDARGTSVHTDTLYFTHRGAMTKKSGAWLSMRWTAYDKSQEADNFLRLGSTRNVNEWLDAMRDYVAPTQNGLVADRGGNIAIRSTGVFPIRAADGRGDLILDGASSANDWKGALPVERYPFSMNPSQGFLASANQQPVDPKQNSAYIGSDWYSPWRAIRINTLLRADSTVTPDEMRQFQTDPGSARADAFVPLFLEAAASEKRAGRSDEKLERAAALLAEWDRRYVRENRRAVLFESAMQDLGRRTWDELRNQKQGEAIEEFTLPESQVLLELANQPASPWWDDRRTSGTETRDVIVAQSLRAALDSVTRRRGDPSSDGWLWRNVRHANIHHLLRIPAFSALAIPVQGGPSTLSPSGGSGTQGASWRMVVELGPELKAWAIYPGGQSGAPASPRYRDRLAKWSTGQLDEVLFPKRAADLDRKRVISRLQLTP